MIHFSSLAQIYIYPEPCDLRRGFNGLSAIIENQLLRRATCGGIFVFMNRRRTRVKVSCA